MAIHGFTLTLHMWVGDVLDVRSNPRPAGRIDPTLKAVRSSRSSFRLTGVSDTEFPDKKARCILLVDITGWVLVSEDSATNSEPEPHVFHNASVPGGYTCR